ncbi:MAG TPA: hypothetical protein VFZ68_01120 [Acidimicrobiales bacterium]
MLVELGPCPSASALAWVAYAREVLATPQSNVVPSSVRGEFTSFLSGVEHRARSCSEMRWSTDTSHEELSFVVHAFHRLTMELNSSEQCRRATRMPEAARPFYRVLVRGLLGALASECTASASFAEELASFWPGVDPAESLMPATALVGRSSSVRRAC